MLDDVLFARGGNVQEHHAAADPLFEVDVLLQLDVRPEVDELDALVHGADAVDPAEALDDADRVPVDVEVDDRVAVLEVLALADAVGGDEQIDLAFLGQVLGTFLGAGREGRDDAGEVLAELRQRRLVVARAGDQGGVQAEFLQAPRGKLAVQVMGGVGEGREDQQLAVVGVDGLAALAADDLTEGVELGIPRRAHLLGRRVERGQPVAVLDEVLPPTDAVHVLEQHLDLAPDQQALERRIVHIHVFDVDLIDRFGVGFEPGQAWPARRQAGA